MIAGIVIGGVVVIGAVLYLGYRVIRSGPKGPWA